MNYAPVLLIVFNRPDTTAQVFEQIKKAKPQKLYIAADGPRPGNKNDEVKCKEVRDFVSNVDWDCELHTDFSEVNLGCGTRPSSAISWVLDKEDSVIILEDDCVPSVAFFNYCTVLLEKYKDTERVMQISGTRYLEDMVLNDDSYFFSRYQRPWGWATWKRAWQHFDIEMKSYTTCQKKQYFKYLFDDYETDYWTYIFDKTLSVTSIWDYQWQYAIFMQEGLCIVPRKNLISNLGDQEGTHPYGDKDFFCQEVDEDFSVDQHPDFIIPHMRYDAEKFRIYHGKKPLMTRVKNKIVNLFVPAQQ